MVACAARGAWIWGQQCTRGQGAPCPLSQRVPARRSPVGFAGLRAVLGGDQRIEQAFLQVEARGGIRGIVPAVVQFLRVGGQVVEFAGAGATGRGRAVVDDQLVAVVAQHRDVDGRVVGMAAVAVLAQRPATPSRAVVASRQRQQALPLLARQWRQSRRVEEGRRQVEPLHQFGAASRRRQLPRPAQDKRHPHRALVEQRPFEQEPVVAEHFPVIAGEDHQRVPSQALLVECGQYPPDLVVNQGDHRVVGRDDRLDFVRRVVGEAARVAGITGVRGLSQNRRPVGQAVGAGERARERLGIVAVEVFLGRDEGMVRVKEVEPEEEGLCRWCAPRRNAMPSSPTQWL